MQSLKLNQFAWTLCAFSMFFKCKVHISVVILIFCFIFHIFRVFFTIPFFLTTYTIHCCFLSPCKYWILLSFVALVFDIKISFIILNFVCQPFFDWSSVGSCLPKPGFHFFPCLSYYIFWRYSVKYYLSV